MFSQKEQPLLVVVLTPGVLKKNLKGQFKIKKKNLLDLSMAQEVKGQCSFHTGGADSKSPGRRAGNYSRAGNKLGEILEERSGTPIRPVALQIWKVMPHGK